MAGDNPDDQGENEALEDAIDDVLEFYHVAQRREERGKRDVNSIIGEAHKRATEPADENRKNHQQRQRHCDGDIRGRTR